MSEKTGQSMTSFSRMIFRVMGAVFLTALLVNGCGNLTHGSAPDRDDELKAVSRSIQDFARQTYPTASIVGTWADDVSNSGSLKPDVYFGAVDILANNKHTTVNVIVRSFSGSDEKPYWKVDKITGSTQTMLNHGIAGTPSNGDDAPDTQN